MQTTKEGVQTGLAFDEVLHGDVLVCAFLLYVRWLGMLYGNHIKPLIRRGISLSRAQRIIYGLWTKGCHTGTQTDIRSYAETIYIVLWISRKIQIEFGYLIVKYVQIS